MNENKLLNDIARCNGSGHEGDWREGCENCLRRTAPRPKNIEMIEPPPIIVFECEHLLEEKL